MHLQDTLMLWNWTWRSRPLVLGGHWRRGGGALAAGGGGALAAGLGGALAAGGGAWHKIGVFNLHA